ncbi:T-cell surface antigen CD2 [Ochotona curzoniae]|uniref:T-cell surface antigen CD2 n=1 Tax=Ochotona curzoniae TaxID=130825 RepID=UPI001B345A40|nr:T-cell surface antigen CD2 [Ochotona curzoniae]
MRLPCETLAGFLLMFSFATEGTIPKDTIWGTLGHDIYLNISEFTGNKAIEEIQWATKEGSIIARLRDNKREYFQLNGTYEIFENGTLKIKRLMRNFSNTYKVTVYNTAGALELEKYFYLEVLEVVSKPNLFWDCSNTTLTCEVVRGTDPQLMLYLNGKYVTKHEKIITHKWTTDSSIMTFKCKATNHVSEKYIEAVVNCAGKGLGIFLIVGICVGGLVLIVFVVLLICYISKRKKRNSRRSGEELEIRAPRPATEERARKLPPLPTSAPASAAASPPPPPPAHGSQAPGHRPLPPVHRVQQQKQKRPPPSGTQVYQQRGPPLPRPRVQPKPPPHGAVENSN